MKWSSLRVSPLAGVERRSFIYSPTLSVSTWRKRRPRTGAWVRKTLLQLAILGALLVVCWWLYLELVPPLRPSTWMQGYLCAVPIYLLTHVASLLLELASSPAGWTYPSHMRWPILSRSIDTFWGKRWGTWVSSWLRQVIFSRYRRRPWLALLLVFVVSGLWHEALLDVPLAAFFGINVLGGWLLYFLIQAAGAAIERSFFKPDTWYAIAYAWAVILLPAPLALNEAALRMVGLFVAS